VPRAVMGCPLHQECGLGEHCRRLLHYHNNGLQARGQMCSQCVALQKQPVTSYCVLCAWNWLLLCLQDARDDPSDLYNWSKAIHKIVCLSGFADVNTASPCDGLTCCVPQLVAGSFQQLDLDSGSDPLQLTACSVSTQPALVVLEHLRHAYGTSTCMLTHFAVTLLNVHTDPGSFPSFAEECRFENWSSDS